MILLGVLGGTFWPEKITLHDGCCLPIPQSWPQLADLLLTFLCPFPVEYNLHGYFHALKVSCEVLLRERFYWGLAHSEKQKPRPGNLVHPSSFRHSATSAPRNGHLKLLNNPHVHCIIVRCMTWWTFRARKKYLAPPPPPKRNPQFSADTLPPPSPSSKHTPLPLWGIFNKETTPPPGASKSPFPLPEQKKEKISEMSTKMIVQLQVATENGNTARRGACPTTWSIGPLLGRVSDQDSHP